MLLECTRVEVPSCLAQIHLSCAAPKLESHFVFVSSPFCVARNILCVARSAEKLQTAALEHLSRLSFCPNSGGSFLAALRTEVTNSTNPSCQLPIGTGSPLCLGVPFLATQSRESCRLRKIQVDFEIWIPHAMRLDDPHSIRKIIKKFSRRILVADEK